LKVGGLIGLTPLAELIEGAKPVKKRLLVRMMTPRNKTSIRDAILLAPLRALSRRNK